MSSPQSYKNHTRVDPLWHFFIVPILLVNIFFAIYLLIHHWPMHDFLLSWWIVLSIALFLAVGRARQHSMKVQDRLIRLEERLRLAELLSPDDLVLSYSLTESQLIGLRFASNNELPALVARTLKEGLTRDQIKAAIVEWRPDDFRV
jgi:hypothetical protein